MTRRKNKLICGWGIKDVDYNVYRTEIIDGKKKIAWQCSYYKKWKSVIQRCFDLKCLEKRPTYKGCTVTEDWRHLSNFIKWLDSQPNKDWENCELDKDLLIKGNKHYSPETVAFVSSRVNLFITDSGKVRGEYMIGVCYRPNSNKKNPYQASCQNQFTGGSRHVGYYPTELEAHLAWQAKKHEYACQLADLQEDESVAKALRERYAPDKDWTKK